MGEILQVRVMVYTYKPEDVVTRWPTLSKMAFGPEYARDVEQRLVQPEDTQGKGVLDLIRALDEGMRYNAWPVGVPVAEMPDTIAKMEPGMKKALAQVKDLEAYLGDWKPVEANRMTVAIEDTLDALERTLTA